MSDFKKTSVGVLPLDFMFYFAEKPAMRQTLYGVSCSLIYALESRRVIHFLNAKFASEKLPKNSDYSFPLAKASIGMVKLLSKILKIGEKGK